MSNEVCGCDTAAGQAPVTVEMIEEAFEHLKNLVDRCQTPVLVNMLIEKGDRVDGASAACEAVVDMSGPKGTEWRAARGYIFASGDCFSGHPETISQGVKLAFKEAHKRVGMPTIMTMLKIAGCECEECQD